MENGERVTHNIKVREIFKLRKCTDHQIESAECGSFRLLVLQLSLYRLTSLSSTLRKSE